MNNYVIIILICYLANFENCSSNKHKRDCINSFSRNTGEAIAVDHLIQKYELEHQIFYQEKIGDGTYLTWPDLNKKYLSDYCRNYLEHCVPSRTTYTAIGSKIRKKLHYERKNKSISNEIVIVQCKFMYKSHRMVYYMTRAPEPNCVYALKSTGQRRVFILTIINKYCDFESNSSLRILKWKREEIIGTIHRRTGQPIAKDEYLLEYELEHQELLEREGYEGKYLGWTYVSSNRNLNVYCNQYLKQCVPSRNHDGIRGKWETGRLHYQKLNTKGNITVIVLQCRQGNVRKVNYLLTRALNENCVYALLQQNGRRTDPLLIQFKHCDFEGLNVRKTILHDCSTVGKNLVTNIVEKKETLDILETLQLFPKH